VAEAERERASQAEAEALVARRAALASSLISEPPAGPGAVQIMVRFPDGKRLQRRFLGEGATMCDIYDWVEAAWEETCAFRCDWLCLWFSAGFVRAGHPMLTLPTDLLALTHAACTSGCCRPSCLRDWTIPRRSSSSAWSRRARLGN